METILKETHLSEDLLEQYVTGRLRSTEVTRANAHMLECNTCFERYEQEVQILHSLRVAQESSPRVTARERLPFWSRFAGFGSPLLAAATIILAVLLVPRLSFINSTPAVAELTAFRGVGSISAPANRFLVLRLDTTGLPVSGALRLEVADAGGQPVWNGTATDTNGSAQVAVNRRLEAGQYWVRLYAATGTDILREYSLNLK